ncbi:MAG TPA: hypothetical protein VFA89_02505 [Terriglobales bacterium]|nr:hypothetical protein [Terriglobales bacterium]
MRNRRRKSPGLILLFLFAVACGGLAWRRGAGIENREEAIAIGDKAQLFVDDHVIETATGVHRQAHEAEKYFPNPVLTYTRPWEGHCVITWGSVLYDQSEHRFKIWYEAIREDPGAGEETYFLYATSPDGIYWDKPELNQFEFQGSRANNIVFHPTAPFDSAVVIRDESDPIPDQRYKMMYYLRTKSTAERGLYGAVSRDGIHWRELHGPLVKAGDRSSFFYNRFRKTYVFMSRPGVPAPATGVTRWIGIWESGDFRSFGIMQPTLWPDAEDAVGTEFYSMQPFTYESLALGYLEMFYAGENDSRYRRLDTQLTISHDGRKWERALDRHPFLEFGPIGSWDGGWVCPASNAPIRRGDKLYIFYQGRRTFHWATRPAQFEQDGETYQINDPAVGHVGSIGLAFLRIDGFASLDAGNTSGVVITKPLVLPPGQDLFVNANIQGTLKVSVLDEAGSPLSGYEASACLPLFGDSVSHRVQWQRGRDLRPLTGHTVRLRFDLSDAQLYSFAVR